MAYYAYYFKSILVDFYVVLLCDYVHMLDSICMYSVCCILRNKNNGDNMVMKCQ